MRNGSNLMTTAGWMPKPRSLAFKGSKIGEKSLNIHYYVYVLDYSTLVPYEAKVSRMVAGTYRHL